MSINIVLVIEVNHGTTKRWNTLHTLKRIKMDPNVLIQKDVHDTSQNQKANCRTVFMDCVFFKKGDV